LSQEVTEEVDDSITRLEDFANGLVDNQIKVALTIAGVFVHGKFPFSFIALGGFGEHVHAV